MLPGCEKSTAMCVLSSLGPVVALWLYDILYHASQYGLAWVEVVELAEGCVCKRDCPEVYLGPVLECDVQERVRD